MNFIKRAKSVQIQIKFKQIDKNSTEQKNEENNFSYFKRVKNIYNCRGLNHAF